MMFHLTGNHAGKGYLSFRQWDELMEAEEPDNTQVGEKAGVEEQNTSYPETSLVCRFGMVQIKLVHFEFEDCLHSRQRHKYCTQERNSLVERN